MNSFIQTFESCEISMSETQICFDVSEDYEMASLVFKAKMFVKKKIEGRVNYPIYSMFSALLIIWEPN